MSIDVDNLYNRRADNRWDRVAIGDILERLSLSEPDKEALIAAPCAVMDRAFARVTYARANCYANQVANKLLASGLSRGDRVALLCDNSIEACLFKFGTAKAGLVAVPINPVMAPDMMVHVLTHVGAEVAIVDAELWAGGATAFAEAGTRFIARIGNGDDPALEALPDFAAFIAGASEIEPEVTIHGDDIWEILPTSGTTSMPKAVMISHTNTYMAAYAQGLSYSRGVGLECDARFCCFFPLIFHVSDHGMLIAAMLCGGSIVIGRRFDTTGLCQAITDEKPTVTFGGSPQLLRELVREASENPDRYDLSSLTAMPYGWGAVDPAVARQLETLAPGVLLIGIFGQTECTPFHRFWPRRWSETYERTAPATNYVGIPSPMLGSTVMDENGASLRDSPNTPGEVVYRSPSVTGGYFRDRAATEKALEFGWFHSGDMCCFDEDGLRIMVDRFKDMIKSGGENVSSLRVESVLAQHPSIRQAAVVGLPDDRWGEAVTGAVVLLQGEALQEEELIRFCRERLAGFETPKRIVSVDALPVTVGGKVQKYKLRQMLAAD